MDKNELARTLVELYDEFKVAVKEAEGAFFDRETDLTLERFIGWLYRHYN